MYDPKEDSGRRIGSASEFLLSRTASPVWAASPRLVSPVTVEGNDVRRPSAPASGKDESIVLHRPGLVPLTMDYREPAVRALSSLFEDLVHRMAGSSHELDLRPESRSHASDPGPEQGPVSPKHAEGACG